MINIMFDHTVASLIWSAELLKSTGWLITSTLTVIAIVLFLICAFCACEQLLLKITRNYTTLKREYDNIESYTTLARHTNPERVYNNIDTEDSGSRLLGLYPYCIRIIAQALIVALVVLFVLEALFFFVSGLITREDQEFGFI